MIWRRLTATLLSACALMLALMALPGPALATVEELSLEELVNRAALIVRGTVIDTSAQWDADHSRIYTYVTLRPIEYVKGAARAGDLVFAVPGGTAGGVTLLVSDVPVFRAGEETVVFLQDEYFRVVGWRQGKYTVEQGVVVETGESSENFIGEIRRVARRSEASSSGRGVGFHSLPRIADVGTYPDEMTIRTQQVLEAPVISGIVPNSGPAHAARLGSADCASDSTSITINGSSFGFTQGTSFVRFWRVGSTYYNACIESWSDAQIQARVPGGVSSGNVQVVTGGGASNGVYFTVTYSYGGGKWPSGAYPQPMSEVYEVNPNCADTTGELTAVQAAADTWSNVSDSDFDFRYGGTSSATSPGYNGHNEIMWVADTGGSIATCHTWWYVSDPNTIIEFDIEFDDGHYLWGTDGSAGKMDVQNTATHELGHAPQLLDLYGTADTEKTMYGFSATGETKRRTLHTDDIAGMRYVYPCLTPGTPVLYSPSDSTSTCDTTPYFEWSSVGGAAWYRVQVDNNSNFGTPEINTTTSSLSYTPASPLSPNTYYWRVRASNSCGDGPWSTVRSFTILSTPGAPSLSLPSNGSSTCDTTPYFEWSSVSGAASYRIQVDNNSNFGTPEINTTTSSLSYTPASPLAPDTYYWRVQASNLCGDGPWSSEWNLTILGRMAFLPVVLKNYAP